MNNGSLCANVTMLTTLENPNFEHVPIQVRQFELLEMISIFFKSKTQRHTNIVVLHTLCGHYFIYITAIKNTLSCDRKYASSFVFKKVIKYITDPV